MPLQPPTYDELVQGAQRELQKLGFFNWTEGSAINAIVKVIAAYLLDIWSTLADLELQTNPTTARGRYLDNIGEMFGVKRLPPQVASTLGHGPSVKFTNNGASSVTVPINTRVWNTANPDIAFFTTRALSLGAGEEAFVDVVAGSAGEDYNVGANTLIAHNAGMAQITVLNVTPIGGGTFFESDDAYRFRIKNALLAKNGATEISLIQALLKVPGVRDVMINEGARGNGSVDVVVVPIDRFASSDLLNAAEQAITDTIAAGISWRLKTPKVIQVDVAVQLRLREDATLAEITPLVEAAVRGYLDNLRVNDGKGGSDLIYNELVSRIQDASPSIIDSTTVLTIDGAPSLATNVSPEPGGRIVSGFVSVS